MVVGVAPESVWKDADASKRMTVNKAGSSCP